MNFVTWAFKGLRDDSTSVLLVQGVIPKLVRHTGSREGFRRRGLWHYTQVRKTMLSAVSPLLKSLRDKGKCKKRSVKQGALGVVNYFDVWNWPQQDKLPVPIHALRR